MTCRLFWLTTLLLLLSPAITAQEISERVDFDSDIRPLLSDRCYVCHGPDEEFREADLRLDEMEDALGESESGNVDNIIAAGEPEESELWLRITSDDPDVVMPPPDSNLKLKPAEIQLIGRWIEQGATWKKHWSLMPIAEAQPPSPDAPIDAFIRQKLREHGLHPSPEASREQLIRRLSFDLTGLPPTLEEIDAFLVAESEQAYERLVDRLLASEAYGERMATEWLDVARYSDTYGYQVDRDRFVWPWRDWVIRAFNNNLPYDQFVTEQLAGDLLPEATRDQVLATTFNRLHPQKVEGGSVPEEFRIEYVADRTQTFATAFLGLTFECARCHDHKYDPFTQREYYQLTAFFDKIDESGLYSYFTNSVPTPTLLLLDDDAEADIATAKARVKREEEQLEKIISRECQSFDKWYVTSDQVGTDAASETVTQLRQRLTPVEHLSFDEERSAPNSSTPGVIGNAVRLSGDDPVNLKTGNFHRYDPFAIACWLKVSRRWERAVVYHRSRAWTDAGSRGYEMLLIDGKLQASLIHFWPGNAISVRTKDEFPIDTWQHVTLSYDGSSRAAGITLAVNGRPVETEVVRDHLYKDITGGGNDHLTIGQRFRDVGLRDGCVDELKVFDHALTAAEIELLYKNQNETPDQLLTAGAKALTSQQQELLVECNAKVLEQRGKLRAARKSLAELIEKPREIMVMRHLETPRQTYLLNRGAYDARGPAVTPETPAALPPMDATLTRDRLGLAQWLTDPNHPLTARVAVNRFWQLIFGQGLVRTPEDFGSQGQLPTHPQLLDWLARDFIDHGWDVKRLLKQLVMSQTYRQKSTATAELLAVDPENRLLARAPSYRLSAEMLRDQALAVSGLLVRQIGGPPVKPYELEYSFKPVKSDEGDGLYRRSLYTFWKRTAPAPAMMALDAAKRDVCRVRRSLTSSPLQTLVLMNGPQYVEAARMLAWKTINTFEDNDTAIVTNLFRTLTGRVPTDEEVAILRKLLAEQLQGFRQDPAAAKDFLSVGRQRISEPVDAARLAAVAAVANGLFGYDESMMKR